MLTKNSWWNQYFEKCWNISEKCWKKSEKYWLQNVDPKNVGPKNVAIFCKMLTKNNYNVAEKKLKHFKFNSNEVGSWENKKHLLDRL
jgi:hypothetical protein